MDSYDISSYLDVEVEESLDVKDILMLREELIHTYIYYLVLVINVKIIQTINLDSYSLYLL
jgi:hypothetical protein